MVESSSTMSAGTKKVIQESCLEGLKASELAMIHRLAGNDPVKRKKTMLKLRKYLAAVASKVPDTPESKDLVDPNFVRVWKALFYCMWMADKPLPQEQLAEQISNLLNIFGPKQNVLMNFIDWFFLTIAREWSLIDRFRLDKFMMLIRRFLRKSLEQLALRKWNKDVLSKFVQIMSVHIFNRHPPMRKTRKSARMEDPPKAPLGFQIHFTDIFLEELAKVGADTLQSEEILQLLSPFIYELAHNDDERLLTEIQERIFTHLMRQSDAALDYMEGGEESSDEDDEEEDEEEEEEEMESGDTNLEENGEDGDEELEESEEEDEEMDYENQPLDPRAGQVDVILPQLVINYEELAANLVESGGQKDVKSKNKKILYSLARGMQALTEGQYPLALPEAGPRKPAITKKEVQTAAQRLVELESNFKETSKLELEKAKKKKKASLSSPAQTSTKSTNLPKSDNEKSMPKKKGSKPVNNVVPSKGQSPEKNLAESTNENSPLKRKRKLEDEVTSAPGSTNSKNNSPSKIESPQKKGSLSPRSTSPDSPLKKKAKQVGLSNPAPARTSLTKPSTPVVKTTPSPNGASAPSLKPGGLQGNMRNSVNKKTSPPRPTMTMTMRTPVNTPTTTSANATPNSQSKKRVSFVLARNSEHPHADYQHSIQRSPAIPYDSAKQPNFGLLKAKVPTPSASPLSGYVIPKRKRAADFF